jgi:hypothetical protein
MEFILVAVTTVAVVVVVALFANMVAGTSGYRIRNRKSY